MINELQEEINKPKHQKIDENQEKPKLHTKPQIYCKNLPFKNRKHDLYCDK